VSLEELQALRLSGAIAPETYIIESGGPEPKAWKRYREIFPLSPAMPISAYPPVPLPTPPVPQPVAPPVFQPTPSPQAHPLFPSAGAVVPHAGQASPVSGVPSPVAIPSTPTAPKPSGKTNGWCGWGFGLSLTALVLFFMTCGLAGWLAALPGLIVSFVGVVQLSKHREQSGLWMAIGGMFLSAIVLALTLVVLGVAVPYVMKHHDLTATEESPNDSQ